MTTVSWRRATAVLAASVLAIVALVVVLRSDGLPATEATSTRAVRWVAHRESGSAVLVDGFAGRAIFRLEAGEPNDVLSVVEGRNEAFIVNESNGDVRSLDTAGLEMGPSVGLLPVAAGQLRAAVAPVGLVFADRQSGAVRVVGPGDPLAYDVEVDTSRPQVEVDPDGTTWSVVGSNLLSVNAGGEAAQPTSLDSNDVLLSLVGSEPLLVDREQGRVRLGRSGPWYLLERDDAATVGASELVVQEPGPTARCGWVAQGDQLWCVGREGVVRQPVVDGLRLASGDRFAIAGDVAVALYSNSGGLKRFDWRERRTILEEPPGPNVPADAARLDLSVTTDAVWIDDVSGDHVWMAHPWGFAWVPKNDPNALVRGDDGEIVDGGEGVPTQGVGGVGSGGRVPDNPDNDDPPVAVDDVVSARPGGVINIPVLANDYDPDGEAVVLVRVGGPAEIGSATTAVFTPESGFVGTQQFDYDIADGDGTLSTGTVTVRILPPDAPNQAPEGTPDVDITTGPGNPVVIDVLGNDVDPERDTLDIAEFGQPTVGGGVGEVRLATTEAGRPALEFHPAPEFEGRATFTYQPVDDRGAVGDDVRVVVDVADETVANRAPVTEPDALRLRASTSGLLAVTSNDIDPDGDKLVLSIDQSRIPPELDVSVEGNALRITALRADRPFVPLTYVVDDGMGHETVGAVLVAVIGDDESNRPPIVNPDQAKVVVGEAVLIDVGANDEDPDGDSLTVIDVTQPDNELGTAVLAGDNQVLFTPFVLADDAEATARFTYTITDGNQHEVVGTVSVTVLPEPLPDPPFARDDFATTFVDEPVTIDVLGNDLDPSGGTPRLNPRIDCQLGGTATVVSDGFVRYLPPAGEDGRFTCRYRVSNSSGGTDDATITITVQRPTPQNEAPIAAPDSAIVTVRQTKAISVIDNDRDPDGDNSELTLVSTSLSPSAPVLGEVERVGNQILFTAGSRTGQTSIVYGVADANGRTAKGTLTVVVAEPANKPPIAVDDVWEAISTDRRASVNVLANDLDEDGSADQLRIVDFGRVSGDATVSQNGRLITAEFDDDYEGVIVVEYTVADADGDMDEARLELTVTPPANLPPSAANDVAELLVGESVAVPVLANDSDPEGTTLDVRIVRGPDPELGRATVENRQIVFRAATGAGGVAEIGYEVSDGELTATATVRITVLPCNEVRPQARSLTLYTPFATTQPVRLEDYASSGTIIDWSGPPEFNRAAGTYTPPPGFNGQVEISYVVVNGCGQRANGTITIDVNQAPTSVGVGQLSAARGRSQSFAIGSYVSDDEPLTIESVSSNKPVWVSVSGSTVTVSPPEGISAGDYPFSVVVSDPGGLQVEQRFIIDVRNDPPVAAGDVVSVADSPQQFSPLGNDYDPDGPDTALRIESIDGSVRFSNGVEGTVQLLSDQRTVLITPNGGRGEGSFKYRAVDADGARSDRATVTVRGSDPNRPPVANDQTVTVPIRTGTRVTLDYSDPDGDDLTVEVIRGDLDIIRGTPTSYITVRPKRPKTFRIVYRVFDGTEYSDAATLTVIGEAPAPSTDPPSTDPPSTDPSDGDGDPEQTSENGDEQSTTGNGDDANGSGADGSDG